jgi:hypothetical protein
MDTNLQFEIYWMTRYTNYFCLTISKPIRLTEKVYWAYIACHFCLQVSFQTFLAGINMYRVTLEIRAGTHFRINFPFFSPISTKIGICLQILIKLPFISMRFEVLTAVKMLIVVFWVVTPCGFCRWLPTFRRNV